MHRMPGTSVGDALVRVAHQRTLRNNAPACRLPKQRVHQRDHYGLQQEHAL